MFIENEVCMRDKNRFLNYMKLSDTELKRKADEAEDSFAQFVYGCKKMAESKVAEGDHFKVGMDYMQRSANNGCPDAENWLGHDILIHEPQKRPSAHFQKGVMLLNSAALKGHFEAAVSLGYLHYSKAEMHNPKEATKLWTSSVINGQEKFDDQSTLHLFNILSQFFSKGTYGTQRKWDLASSLHILSFAKFVSPEIQRGIILLLCEIALDKPDFFQNLKSKGLIWPSQHEIGELIRDESLNDGSQNSKSKIRERRINICNSFRSLMVYDADIRTEMTAYLKDQLPSEIRNIPNLVFQI
jgi:hypothetical protein